LDVVMTIKLCAHSLRSGSAEGSAATWSLDLRHWVFRDFVVRRPDLSPWGVRQTTASDGVPGHSAPAAPEPLWADTQPCWRE
jgi:hypothetical protein